MFHYVSAGAGCGKTTFIIKKIINLLKNNDNKTKILVITYTNSCVEEIIHRLQDELQDYINNVDVCTFHALCNKFTKSNKIFTESNNLQLLGSYINIHITPEFQNFYNYFLYHTPFDYIDYKAQLKKNFPGKEYKEKLNNLEDFFKADGTIRSRMPTHIANKEEWLQKLQVLKEHFNAMNYKYNLNYLIFFKEIETARQNLNLYTFHHMILETLSNIHEFTMHVWEQYAHIFIDEVQDLSHIQFEIIKHLAEEMIYLPNKSITIVGDIHQSIFSFQGANRSNFNKFIEDIKKIPQIQYKEEKLNKTYRFGGEILDFVNKNFYHHESDNIEGKIYYHNLSKDYKVVLEQIHQEINKIDKKDKILILFQKRNQFVNQLQEYLEKNPLIKIYIHKKIFHHNGLLEDFFHLLEFIVSRQEIYLAKFLMGGMIYIPEPDFFNLCKRSKQNKGLWQELINSYGELDEIKTLKLLYNINNLNDFLNIFLESSLQDNFYKFYGQDAYIFINELNKISNSNISLYNLLSLKKHDLWFQQDGGIAFSTIHNAKGTEADHVFIIDGNNTLHTTSIFLKNNFPMYHFFKTSKNNKNSEEFKNLLYVAVTRARKSLHIFGVGIKPNPATLYDLTFTENE